MKARVATGKLGIGVIGCGAIAYWVHLRVARRLPGATLVAAADPDPEARKRAEKLAGIEVHARTDDLLARDDIDAVIISGPTHLHADLAISACDAGKHIYLEKPLASSLEDGARVADAVKRSGVTLALGFNRRFHPLNQQAKRLIAAGRIGRIHAVFSTFCERATPDSMPGWKRRRETGGGVLLDLATHHIDLMRWFLDDEVASVSASIGSELSEQDSARMTMSMRNGVQVQGWFSSLTSTGDSLEFFGSDGTLRVDRHRTSVSLRVPRRFGYGVRSARTPPDAALAAWRVARIARPSNEPSYLRSLTAFVRALSGSGPPMPTVDDGMRALEVIEAAELASHRGETVRVRPVID